MQPLYVSVMRKTGDGSVRFDNEGSGYGFKTERYLPLAKTMLPTSCRMKRPE
jgi:branched-chain amino acid transport system substrate-binding protein